MPKHLSYFSLVIAVISMLSACGGGSGGTSKPPILPPPPPPPLGAILSDSPEAYSSIALSSMDSMLQLGYLADNLVDVTKASVLGKELICSNGGVMEYEFSAPNTADFVVGEQLTVNYMECEVSELNSLVSGSVTLNAVEMDSAQDVGKVSMLLDGLEVISEQTVTLAGQILVSLPNEAFNQQWELDISDELEIQIGGEPAIVLSEFAMIRTASFDNAKYAIEATAQITESASGGRFGVITNEPITGYFGEFPNAGEVVISSTASADDLIITANFVEDSELFDLQLGSITQSVFWHDAVEGAIWSYNGKNSTDGNRYRADNFAFLGARVDSVDNFSILGNIELVLSRPVGQVDEPNILFEPVDWGVPSVEAIVKINGAIVTLTPSSPLMPGESYHLNSINVVSELGQSVWAFSPQINTSSEAIANIDTASYFYSFTDVPTVTVTTNFADGSTPASYRWSDPRERGVVFNEPELATTSLNMSGVQLEQGALDIHVEVESTTGLLAYAAVKLNFIPDDQTILAFASENGDYIGNGQTKVFTLNDGNFALNSASPHNYIDANFNGSAWWNLDLAAAQNEPLQVGKYTGATRWPFQSPTSPGLSFTGDGRGCNESFGEFEIFELEFEQDVISKLAVSWTQYCESEHAPALRGVLRFNSEHQF